MKCLQCNAELLEDLNFCPYCGAAISKEEKDNIETKEDTISIKEEEAKCWAKFAKISKILGIISICTFWIPIYGILAAETGVPGIVFGCLGKRTKNLSAKKMASTGFILSIIGIILSIVFLIVWYVIIIYSLIYLLLYAYLSGL